jgi:hypothetical protein
LPLLVEDDNVSRGMGGEGGSHGKSEGAEKGPTTAFLVVRTCNTLAY